MNRKDLQELELKFDTFYGPKAHPDNTQYDTAEGIRIKEHYSKEDIAQLDHLNFAAGFPPYLRGPYTTMYVRKPWTIRQYAGFSTAEQSNAFYKRNLAAEIGRAHV